MSLKRPPFIKLSKLSALRPPIKVSKPLIKLRLRALRPLVAL